MKQAKQRIPYKSKFTIIDLGCEITEIPSPPGLIEAYLEYRKLALAKLGIPSLPYIHLFKERDYAKSYS